MRAVRRVKDFDMRENVRVDGTELDFKQKLAPVETFESHNEDSHLKSDIAVRPANFNRIWSEAELFALHHRGDDSLERNSTTCRLAMTNVLVSSSNTLALNWRRFASREKLIQLVCATKYILPAVSPSKSVSTKAFALTICVLSSFRSRLEPCNEIAAKLTHFILHFAFIATRYIFLTFRLTSNRRRLRHSL